MKNKNSEPELTYVRINENIPGNPDIKIRLLDEQQSRGEGYEGEMRFIDLKVTLPLPLTYLDKFA